MTVYEALEDAGLVAAAMNITCYRGRTPPADAAGRHAAGVRAEALLLLQPLRVRPDRRAARGAQPRAAARSTRTPPRSAAGSSRATASTSSSYYLSDFDFASHAHGPDGARRVALARTDAAIRALLDAAGGPDEFLERYAVIVCSDHGQTHGRRAARLQAAARDVRGDIVVTASNRAGRSIYSPTRASTPPSSRERSTARRRSRRAAARGRRGCRATRRRGAAFRRGRRLGDERRLLDPRLSRRLRARRAALRTRTRARCSSRPRAGWEFADLAGSHHAGGGSHGSLIAGDSEVPMLASASTAARAHDRRQRRGARALRRRACAVRHVLGALPDGARWSSSSCARAASTTSACSTRWSACRASSSCRRSCATARTTMRRCRSAPARRSRSRTWSR